MLVFKSLAIVLGTAACQLSWSFYLWPNEPGTNGTYQVGTFADNGTYTFGMLKAPTYLPLGCSQGQWCAEEMAHDYQPLNWGFGVGTANQALKGYMYVTSSAVTIPNGSPPFQTSVAYSVSGSLGRQIANINSYGTYSPSDSSLRWVCREYRNHQIPTIYPAPSQWIAPQTPYEAADDGLPFIYTPSEEAGYQDFLSSFPGEPPFTINKWANISHQLPIPPSLADEMYTTLVQDYFLCLYQNGDSVTILDGIEITWRATVDGYVGPP